MNTAENKAVFLRCGSHEAEAEEDGGSARRCERRAAKYGAAKTNRPAGGLVHGHVLDQASARPDGLPMKTLNVSRAKAGFSGIARRVIKSREPVLVKTPTGYVQIVPFDVPEFVPPAEAGSIRLTDREVALANTLGETL